MKNIILVLSAVIFSTFSHAEAIVKSNDLLLFNPQQQIELMNSELAFWNGKLDSDQNNHMYLMKLAGVHDAIFKMTGYISDLKKSETLIRQSLKANNISQEGGLRSLAQNMISQHRFCEALDYAMEAEYLGGDLRKTQLVLFDINMELGNNSEAVWYLNKISEMTDFDFLIRQAKWEDKIGNLAGAIENLEMAMLKAESSNNLSLMSWIYSNIADFYGHNGEILKSKKYYEKALKINQADWYSIKKMAWIAWSYDNNPDIALKMLHDLKLFNDSPSINILIADIKLHQGDVLASEKIKKYVFDKVSSHEYGYMYNAFLNAQLLKQGNFEASKRLVDDEINRRPSVDSYVMLLNYYAETGDLAAAKNVGYTHLLGHTFEPLIMLDVQKVLEPGNTDKKEIIEELVNCSFELGPLLYMDVPKLAT